MPTAAASEEQERAARIDTLLAAAAGRGVDDLGELLSSQYLGSFPLLQSYVDGMPLNSGRSQGARRRAARSGRPVPQLADALEAVAAIAARQEAREARRAALLATAAACGISLDEVMAKWPPARASELEVRRWCAAQPLGLPYDDRSRNVFSRCVLFVDAGDCVESERQEALAEAKAALMQWHDEVDAIMRRLSPIQADIKALQLGISINDGKLRAGLLSTPHWPWSMTALEESMATFFSWNGIWVAPYAGLGYDYSPMLHTVPILMGSPYRRLVDILCSQRQPVLESLGLPYNSGNLLVAPWATWTPETHMRVALPRLIDAVQVLLLALHRLRLWLPPPLLRRIIEQAISLAAPSDVQKPCPTGLCQGMAPCQGCKLGLCRWCCCTTATGPPCPLHSSRLL